MRRVLILPILVSMVLFLPTPTHAARFRPCANATIVGTAGDDLLLGTAARDVIRARSGDDVILGLGGGDVICGNRGRDRIMGRNGDVTFAYGGGGKDRCIQVSFESSC